MNALVRCHLCGAALDPGTATPLLGPPGYQPALRWPPHDRPDGKGKCRIYTGCALPTPSSPGDDLSDCAVVDTVLAR